MLLTGATGFVGRHLWPALEAAGYRVRGLTRNVAAARRRWPEREWIASDLESPRGWEQALERCGAAYYLLHGMGEADDFRAREMAVAQAFAGAAGAAGIKRIVYLGGIAPAGPASEHLRSRLEVGEALRAGPIPALELRAGMIVGFGSISWLMVRDLAARLPAMVLPRWLRRRSQPVGIDDVVAALVAGLRLPLDASASFDIPGPDLLTGRAVLEQTAAALGLHPPLIVEVPLLTPWLSSHWVRLVTRADWAVARHLVLGLQYDLIARDGTYWERIDHRPLLAFPEAAHRALAAEATSRQRETEQEASGDAPRSGVAGDFGRAVERLVTTLRRERP